MGVVVCTKISLYICTAATCQPFFLTIEGVCLCLGCGCVCVGCGAQIFWEREGT